MKNKLSFLVLFCSLILIIAISPRTLAVVENQIVGFFGVTPVLQQPQTRDLVVSLQNYGLLGTGTTAGITPINADHIIQTGTAILTGAAIPVGTLRVSGTNLLIATGSGTWITK